MIGQRVGNYVIEQALKKGGMGSVYVARHPTLGKRVAVKFLDAYVDNTELSQRFLNEARVTASLEHPNIVGIYDFGDLNGKFYYVMDLLVGHDLGEHLDKHRLTIAQCVDFLTQIGLGLQAAHDRGIVHRDLKPANVFVSDGDTTVLKLMDFGVAKVLAQEVGKTNYGQLLGTPAYMAPEQAMGDLSRISAQTDLYAMGVIAYELISGRPPFTHESPMMLMVAHIHEDFPPLAELAPQAPAQLCQLIERCLQKNPTFRPVSAGELVRQLQGVDLETPALIRNKHAEDQQRLPLSIRDKTTSRGSPSTRLAETSNEPVSPFLNSRAELNEPNEFDEVELPIGQGESPSVCLDENDRSLLAKLLQRMKRRGELPAFIANVGDVNKKADFEGKYSARQLGESILKDHSLTAKLLRIVNTNYINRFGGKVYSIQQAIVILGFEQVRSLALSIAVFDKDKKNTNSDRIADSAVHSLVSGELARSLAKSVGLLDEEETTICSMFCNLGRHLALVYLPEQYDRALGRSRAEGISLDRAAEKELGLSFQKLGIGIAEQWHLPPQLVEAMSAAPVSGIKSMSDQQKLASLAHFSNELCELVATGLNGEGDPKLKKLLVRHKNLLEITPEQVPQLLAQVEEGFRTRYAVLLGTKARHSRFLQKLPEISPQSSHNRADQLEQPSLAPRRKLERNRERGKRQVQDLVLGKPINASPLSNKIEAVRALLYDRRQPEQALAQALRLFCEHLNLPRVIALTASKEGGELLVSDAFGDDAAALSREVRFTINPSIQANDVFSKAFNAKKDVFVRDSYSEKSSLQIPPRYYEVFGSPAFALLPCQDKGGKFALLLAHVTDPDRLPSGSELEKLDDLKALIALAAAA